MKFIIIKFLQFLVERRETFKPHSFVHSSFLPPLKILNKKRHLSEELEMNKGRNLLGKNLHLMVYEAAASLEGFNLL